MSLEDECWIVMRIWKHEDAEAPALRIHQPIAARFGHHETGGQAAAEQP